MPNIRALKERIGSVDNIRQITRAMEMVATTKLRRFQSRAESSSPYAAQVRALTARLAGDRSAREGRPLFHPGRGEGRAILLITSDRGLCGAYNTNILNLFRRETAQVDRADLRIHLVGRHGLGRLPKLGLEPAVYLDDPPLEKAGFDQARRIAAALREEFLAGEAGSVHIHYTEFVSMGSFLPRAVQLLPIDPAALAGGGEEEAAGTVDYLFEPGRLEILDSLLPRYLEVQVWNAMIQSLTAEFASRRMAMKNATDAAVEMKGTLVRTYNRVRQEMITTELLDIVGAAEALR